MPTSHDQSWAGQYWGWNGALRGETERHLARLHDRPQDWGAMSGMSSAYYSAAGNAVARARDAWLLGPFWAVSAVWCAERALGWSDRLWETIPHTEMTPDICDVRQSVCRKVSAFLPWRRSYLGKASSAIENGIFLLGRGAPHAPHTRPLLLIGQADVMLRTGEEAEKVKAVIRDIRSMADAIAAHLSHRSKLPATIELKRQCSRLYRGLSDLYRRTNQAAESQACRQIAERLANESGAADQIIKLGAQSPA